MEVLKRKLTECNRRIKELEQEREAFKKEYALKLEHDLAKRGIVKGTIISVDGMECGAFHHLVIEGTTFPCLRVYYNLYTPTMRVSKKQSMAIALSLGQIKPQMNR